DHSHSHDHRNFADIKALFQQSSLSDKVVERALAIFSLVAEAEGKIHNKAADQVHFHEVGAVDSIVDIAAAAICLDYLNPAAVYCSSVELGGGFVKCAHGLMPVPAPATLEILKGVPVKTGAVPFETTTPTGAAILAASVDRFTDSLSLTPIKTAYGVGHRDTDIPNVLRVSLLSENEEVIKDKSTEAVLMDCNIDDMNPELYSPILEKLFEKGVYDAYMTPIIMKKGRPAVKLTILAPLELEAVIGTMILRETSSFGYRTSLVKKQNLDRNVEIRGSSLGEVRVKTLYSGEEKIKSKLEFEDCLKVSREKNLSLPEVYRILTGELL
ncbi:MAG: nickel pincer cofactor biosynthesis protein LarC, partial [Spirochaetales bacterium]|nr:nickel pincer cofactor biosynthesis protein LarC [Spirochaetales bacterium]